MKITICGSLKFFDKETEIQKELERRGHVVFMPIKAPGVDYWAEDNSTRVTAKRGMNLISEHMRKIEQSDAILVANFTKGDIANYIGANTFMEMGFAHHLGKEIFILNRIPDQQYIKDELESMELTVLSGDLTRIA